MDRRRLLALLACLALVAAFAGTIATTPADAAPAPQPSHAFGKSLGEWMVLYNTWMLGGSAEDHVGNVRFLPIPAGELVGGSWTNDDPAILVGHGDVTLERSEKFALPVMMWIGETYDPDLVLADDPPMDSATFMDASILVEIDGHSVIDSSKDALSRFYFPASYFDQPIMYASPTDYGAIGAIYVQGIGFVHGPLSVGAHVMSLDSGFPFVRFQNTWDITVTK